jgi:hypothetical protein
MDKTLIYCTLLLLCFAVSGCKDQDSNEPGPTGVVVMQTANIIVKSTTGEDLLDSANNNGIKDFKIYYLVNGVKTLYNEPNLDASNGYRLIKHPVKGYYYLQVQLDGGRNISETTTYLQLGSNGDIDTIKAHYKADPNNIITEKIWFNGSLVWSFANGEPIFEIVKP